MLLKIILECIKQNEIISLSEIKRFCRNCYNITEEVIMAELEHLLYSNKIKQVEAETHCKSCSGNCSNCEKYYQLNIPSQLKWNINSSTRV